MSCLSVLLIKFILTYREHKIVIPLNVSHTKFSYMYTFYNASKLSSGCRFPIVTQQRHVLRHLVHPRRLPGVNQFGALLHLVQKLHKKTWSFLSNLNCRSKLHKPNFTKPSALGHKPVCLQVPVWPASEPGFWHPTHFPGFYSLFELFTLWEPIAARHECPENPPVFRGLLKVNFNLLWGIEGFESDKIGNYCTFTSPQSFVNLKHISKEFSNGVNNLILFKQESQRH